MAALKKQTAAGFSLFLYNLAHLASEKKVRKKQWKELKSDEKQSRRNYKRIYERKGEEMLGGGSWNKRNGGGSHDSQLGAGKRSV